MSYRNRIRLPLYIRKAQFPTERNIFRKADGSSKVLSVVIKSTHEGITEYLPEDWHKKLIVALSHDTVHIENERYLTDIVLDSDYKIEWQDFKDYPIAQANFTVQSSPFDATNSNCQTCEQATQLSLVNDYFPGTLSESSTDVFANVLANDSICCYPSVVSLTSFNSGYLVSAVITQAGKLTIVVKPSVATATGVLVATYRVTCPDGSYDEANVYADFSGTMVGCNPPTLLVVSAITDTTATVSYNAAIPAPGVGYVWDLFDAANPVTPLQSGTAAGLSVNLTGMVPDFTYLFAIHSDCGGSTSTTTTVSFTTTGSNANCGDFIVYYEAVGEIGSYSYLDCNGVIQTFDIIGGTPPVHRCMYINTGAVQPFFFAGASPGITYDYIGLC